MSHLSLLIRSTIAAAVAVSLLACSSAPQVAGPAVVPRPATPPQAVPRPPPPPRADFVRPAAGPTLSRFDGNRNKGLDIGGNLGDPVVASADGRVVYVGSELRGYGNMVIVRHNETYLTAYAHAQRILVKEKDVVRQGQTIAEMGDSGAGRVMLHFEMRKQGVAVDPEPYLTGQAH